MSQNLLAANTLLPKVLASQQMSDTNPHPVYTAPVGGGAVVKQAVACNVGGASLNLTLAIVPSGQSFDGTHRVLNNVPLAAGDTLPLNDYLLNAHLGAGDAIHVQSSVAGALDVTITGLEAS